MDGMYYGVLLDKAVHITQTRRTRDHACHPSTWEVGTGGSEAGHLQLHSECKASLSYMRVRKKRGGKKKKRRKNKPRLSSNL